MNLIFTFLVFSFLISGDYIYLEQNIGSLLNTSSIKIVNNKPLVSTYGGIYSVNDNFESVIENLDVLSINNISIDPYNQIWLSSINEGMIQILDENFNIINVISYPEFDHIISVHHTEAYSFAIGCNGDCFDDSGSFEYFMIKYNNNISEPFYVSKVDNLSCTFNKINDISFNEGNIYVATDNCLSINEIDYSSFTAWEEAVGSAVGNFKLIDNNIAIKNNSVINISDDQEIFSENDLLNAGINGGYVDLHKSTDDENKYYLLTTKNLYELNLSDYTIINKTISKPEEIISDFTSFDYLSGSYYFGIENSGFVVYNKGNDKWSHFIPNTLFTNIYDAITIQGRKLIGINKFGGSIINNVNSIDRKNIANFHPTAFQNIESYNKYYQLTESNYIADIISYWGGGKNQSSIIVENESIIFTNSGSYPFFEENIETVYDVIFQNICDLTSQPIIDNLCFNQQLPEFSHYGAIGKAPISNISNISMKSVGVVGGLFDGSYCPNEENHFDNNPLEEEQCSFYMTVNEVKKDIDDNVWIVNPNCESFVNEEGNHNNRPIAVQLSGTDEWIHINDYDDDYYLPQSITFSKNNILWVSYRFFQKEDLTIYSKGGLRLVDYNVINDEKDDVWYDVNLYDDDGNLLENIWSIEVGLDSYGNEILWILSDYGVQGYLVDLSKTFQNDILLNLTPINYDFYFKDLSFGERTKLKVDKNNNVWIVTNNSGLRMIDNKGNIWSNGNGFEIDRYNYRILSDNINDITFDEYGRVFISTDKGLSVLNTSFSTDFDLTNLSVSPNPFIIGKHNEIQFSNIPANSNIKIMDLSGIVYKDFKIEYNNEIIPWNGNGNNGQKIGTGIYLAAGYNQNKNSGVTKLAIVRK